VFLFLGFFSLDTVSPQDTADRTRQQNRVGEREDKLHGVGAEIEEPDEDGGYEILQHLDFDYGGIFRINYYNFDDGEDTHMLRTTDILAWVNLVYNDMHQVYARLLGRFDDYNAGTEYYYMEENDQSVPRLDVGYYHCNLKRIIGLNQLDRFRFKAGRDFLTVGEGLALDRRGDGAFLEFSANDFSLSGFVMRSIYSEDGSDRTMRDFGHDKRVFSGIEAGYEFSRELEIFGYTMFQQDKNDDRILNSPYKTGRDSRFHGIGLRGEYGPGLTYSGEFSKEYGEQHSWATFEKSDVDAYALSVETEYTFRTVAAQPSVSVQYILASGDRDAGNTLDTKGGNFKGTDYDAYSGFGYANTGLVFFPRLSNIQVWRVGTAIHHSENKEGCIMLESGINAFYYRRDESKGGISDRYVDKPGESYLGQEIDAYLIWRPFSDLSVIAQYGLFWPERKSFEDDSNRHYFSIGLSFYF